jgi:hypothetical protein
VASDEPGQPGDGGDAEELAPAGAEPTGRVTNRNARLRWIGGFVGVVGLIAGLVVFLGRDDHANPDAELKAAQHVVATSDSYRFELKDKTHTETGDPNGAGTETTSRDLTTTEVAARDRWHSKVTISDSLEAGLSDGRMEPSETVRDGDQVWSRGGGFFYGQDQSASPPWTTFTAPAEHMTVDDYAKGYADMAGPVDETDPSSVDPQGLLEIVVASYVLPVQDDPANIKRLIEDATDPVVEEQLADGGLRLRARLKPIPQLAKLSSVPVPIVDLVIDLDRDSRPTAARFTAAVKGASKDVEVTYAGWGTPVSVTHPDDAQVDHTPWIAEEDLAKVDPALRLAPSQLPGDLALAGASVSNDEYGGDSGTEKCPSVELSYLSKTLADYEQLHANDDPGAADSADTSIYDSVPNLDLSITTEACDAGMNRDSPFDQVIGGHPARVQTDFGEIDIKMGGLVVQMSTSFAPADLEGLVASIRAVTVDELAASIPQWARQGGTPFSGGYPGPQFGLRNSISVTGSGL